MRQRVRRIGVLLVAAAIAAGMAAAGAGGAAAQQNALDMRLGLLDDQIAREQETLLEIERQAKVRVDELSAWMGFWQSIKDLARSQFDTLKSDFDQRIKILEAASGGLTGTTSRTDQRNVPGVGWVSTESLANNLLLMRSEAEKVRQLFADGKETWHYAALGWLTGEAIQGHIDGIDAEIQAILKGVQDGTFQVHINSTGWIVGKGPRDRIAAHEAEQQRLRDLAARGEFVVDIPGLGPHTRNTLDARIAAIETTIADLRTRYGRGEVAIHRPAIGWQTRDQLEQALADGERSFEAMKLLVGQGLYTIWINAYGAGWLKGEDIDARVKSIEEGIETAAQQVRDSTYTASTLLGWQTRLGLVQAIDTTGKSLQNPDLRPEQREALAQQLDNLRKSLAEWQKISALDLVIKGLEKSRVGAWAALPLKLAKPDFDRRELIRAEQTAHLADFPEELSLALAPHERELARLRAARAWIPGGTQ